MRERAFERFTPAWGYARQAAERFWAQVEAGERSGPDFVTERSRLAEALPESERDEFINTFTEELLAIGEAAYPPAAAGSIPDPVYVQMAAVRIVSRRASRALTPHGPEDLQEEANRLAHDLPAEQRPAFFRLLNAELKRHPELPRINLVLKSGWYDAAEPYVLLAAGVAAAIIAAFYIVAS